MARAAVVKNCDICSMRQSTVNIECVVCATNFFQTTSGTNCCPRGCNSCEGDDGTICTSCKSSYYLYNGDCEICGNNCLPPQDGSASCNPVTGACYLGCLSGWEGSKCDIDCNLNNCTNCSDGYWGSQCQYTCNSNCVKIQGENTCAISNGSCDHGCMPGFYKSDCSGTCPNCGHDVCNRNTGNCLDMICDPGYYGTNCNFTCPGNCKPNSTTLQPYCDFSYGNCTYGCVDGSYGSYCQLGCSVNCAASPTETETGSLCRQADGACLYQCKAGYYQPQCHTACVSQCVDNTCDTTKGTCLECEEDNPGYLCPTGMCTAGKYGMLCQFNCPTNCKVCGRYDGLCWACKSGFYGETCDKQCGHCLSGICSNTSGVCNSNCLPGYWGDTCNQTCLYTGCRTCFKNNGECETCKTAYYGSDCVIKCSEFCSKNVYGLISCNMTTGFCDEGSCQAGYWNGPCDQTCSATCLDQGNSNRPCAYLDGNCSFGCANTYYGGQCTLDCSTRCSNRICDRNGACAVGCIIGAYGNQCELACRQTCKDGTCNKATGECEDCNKPVDQQTALCRTADLNAGSEATGDLTTIAISGIIAGCVTLIIVFIIASVCYIHNKRLRGSQQSKPVHANVTVPGVITPNSAVEEREAIQEVTERTEHLSVYDTLPETESGNEYMVLGDPQDYLNMEILSSTDQRLAYEKLSRVESGNEYSGLKDRLGYLNIPRNTDADNNDNKGLSAYEKLSPTETSSKYSVLSVHGNSSGGNARCSTTNV